MPGFKDVNLGIGGVQLLRRVYIIERHHIVAVLEQALDALGGAQVLVKPAEHRKLGFGHIREVTKGPRSTRQKAAATRTQLRSTKKRSLIMPPAHCT